MTEINGCFDRKFRPLGAPIYKAAQGFFSNRFTLIYIHIDSTHTCVSFEKENRRNQGTNGGIYRFMPSPTYSAPTNPCRCSLFPPAFVGLAARPRAPTSPAMLDAGASSIAKTRRSRGPPYSRRPRATALWRLGARGRAAEPTPSHSRALGRAPCFGLPTNAGGGRLPIQIGPRTKVLAETGNPAGVAGAPGYSHGQVLVSDNIRAN